MAGTTKRSSPFHEQMCVAGSTILGGAVGATSRNVNGIILGAGAGYMIGVLICSRDIISQPIRNLLDFQRALDQVANDASTQQRLIAKMVKDGIAKDPQSAAILLYHVVGEAKKNPAGAFHGRSKEDAALKGHAALAIAHISGHARMASSAARQAG